MKKKYIIRKFLSLFIILSILNSCSNDDNLPCTNFLECEEGNLWIDDSNYTDEITYIRFVNNEDLVLEIFYQFLPQKRECFHNYYISESWGEMNIAENTLNKIEFIILPPPTELNTVEFIFIKSNEILTLTFTIYDEYGSSIESTKSVLTRSNVNVNELPICNAN